MFDKESSTGPTVLAETSSTRHGTLRSRRNISGTTDGINPNVSQLHQAHLTSISMLERP